MKELAKRLLTAIGLKGPCKKLLNNLSGFSEVWTKIDAIEGFLVPGQEEWLFKTAKSLRNGARIVEIGCFKGRSTACLAFGCLGSRKHVVSIDLFGRIPLEEKDSSNVLEKFTSEFFDTWKTNLERNNLSDYATPIRGNSRVIGEHWVAPIDLLFIDGSHDYEDVVKDFGLFYEHVVPGGVVAIHDVVDTWEGSFRAWHEHIKLKLVDTGLETTLAYGRKPMA